MLKTDLHMHVKEDPEDYKKVKYSGKKLVDSLVELGYEAVSITGHNFVFDRDIKKYAEKKGLLFIPGAEINIKGKHVLVYNVNNKDIKGLKTFDDLRALRRRKNILVIAPHPFFVFHKCLGRKLEKNIDCFDAIEYNAFFTDWFDLNKKSIKLARKYNKSMVANSDAHAFFQLGKTYTLVDSKPNKKDFLEAIKDGKVKMVRKPLGFKAFLRVILKVCFR